MSFVDDSPSDANKPTNGADDDLDPAAFLKSVRELSEKREREDAERYRKLEEEVEKGRRERAARRLERARSISPEKKKLPSSVSTPLLNANPSTESVVSDHSAMEAAAPESPTKDIPEFKGFGGRSNARTQSSEASTPSMADPSTPKPAQSATSLARSGTLSWQQRPSSRGAETRPRSMVLPDTFKKPESTASVASAEGSEPSRDQIAASLGSRDPAWFRQTADRGLGNAAFRKSKEDSTPSDGFASGRRGLPGMSRGGADEPATAGSPTPSEKTVASETTSRTGSVRSSTISSGANSTVRTSTSSRPDLKSLIAADQEQEKASPMSERTTSVTDGEQPSLGRAPSMSSSQARIANAVERPSSPTKGMGGFVQSAMMKRSDSVNKRWSAQPGATSLSRESSVRSGYGGLQGSLSMPRLEPSSSSREGSNEPSSRPSSSSSNLTNLTMTQGREDRDIFVKPSLRRNHSRSKSVASSHSTTAEEGHTSPTSPSKRFSPTKSSWLESAITKPDSPKPAPAARNSQPSWMADIAKAKAQKASGETTPKPAEEPTSRPGSPAKAPFGQGMLKRAESRDLNLSRSNTPKLPGDLTPRSLSPTKQLLGQGSLSRPQSGNLAAEARSATPSGEVTRPSDTAQPESGPQDAEVAKPGLLPPTTEPSKQESTPTPQQKSTVAEPVVKANLEHEPSSQATSLKSLPTTTKPKPETPPKPQTDFRSTLRSRPPSDAKQQETPEFLSKFGHLRKATIEKYVAPDVLKDNILRGKSDLTKTNGPVKTPRRDELKESLLAKKDQWKKEKEEGIVPERKISNPPQTPQKPEALAKRELLGKADVAKVPASPEKPKTATPEALARHKSLKEKPKMEATMPSLEKQTSAPASSAPDVSTARETKQPPVKQLSESSKLAARFNPALANVLARGPPTGGSNPTSRSASPGVPERTSSPAIRPPSETPADGAQLQDMRKGRAKGPKRRKGGPNPPDAEQALSPPLESGTPREARPLFSAAPSPEPVAEPAPPQSTMPERTKPRAPPGSAASLMVASLQRSNFAAEKPKATNESPPASQTISSSTPQRAFEQPTIPQKSLSGTGARQPDQPPSTPANSPALQTKPTTFQQKAPTTPSAPPSTDVPEFGGFGSMKRSTPSMRVVDDNKENAGEASPSVKASASMWGRPPSPKKPTTPAQIQLPSRKDEEAAMRSAGLLASSPSRPRSSNGLGITSPDANGSTESPRSTSPMPPMPLKPSRAVSGQLQSMPDTRASAEVISRLQDAFGSVPSYSGSLTIDVYALITSSPHHDRVFRTVRKTVHIVSDNGSLKQLPQQEEYTFFDERVYLCHHAYSIGEGPKKNEIFLWTGSSSTANTADNAQAAAKKMAKEAGNAFVHTVRQGMEPPGFLQALGGILVTRRGSREGASKQYMLCGRKHLGQIVFDEVEFGVSSLCSGFAYLISYPLTLQETKLYLWKGSACSSEELSGARLAAMDLTETGDIIEVDDGAEFASFLKIFGPGTTKASIPKATELWKAKAQNPHAFATRLFRIQPETAKQGFFGGMFARRGSWKDQSPSRKQIEDVKVTVQEISPFTQADLDVDGVYLLDAHSRLLVLVGPMFSSQPEGIRNSVLGQAVMLAEEYAAVVAEEEGRQNVPGGLVVLDGTPEDVKVLFRHWDEGSGLWGTAGLMAGSRKGSELCLLDTRVVRGVVCSE